MKRLLLGATLIVFVSLPVGAAGQGVGLAARAGTVGFGGELALDITERVVVRGGVGFMPLEPNATINGLDVELFLPTWYGAGVDFYVNGALRIGAGVLFKPKDPEVRRRFSSSQDIGSQTFSPQELGTLTGVVDSSTQAPYILFGFGKHTDPGVGLFLDVGVALLSEPEVNLSAEGGTLSPDQDPLRSALDEEQQAWEDDMPQYLRFWPILNLGLRVGFD